MRNQIISLAAASAAVLAQSWDGANQTRNLTPDGYWHNRYFAMLSMSAYGDYPTTCPNQSFTEESKLSNFPDSPLPPWTLLESFGPTPSGAEGFTAVVPEMNKVLVVFKGNPQIEANLPLETAPWQTIPSLNSTCQGCTMNAAAAQAYLEAVEATNDFEITRNRYYGSGLVYAITGHGFGGMLALIHSVDYNQRLIAYYSHNQGTPRTFNQAGADWYNMNFNGEAGERGVWNNDQFGELIPASEDYAHAGTTFKYWGLNETSGQPNWEICWDEPDSPACAPAPQMQNGIMPTPLQDHYWAFTPVTQCGVPAAYDFSVINQFIIANVPGNSTAANLPSAPVPAWTPRASATGATATRAASSTARAMSSSAARVASSVPTTTFARWA